MSTCTRHTDFNFLCWFQSLLFCLLSVATRNNGISVWDRAAASSHPAPMLQAQPHREICQLVRNTQHGVTLPTEQLLLSSQSQLSVSTTHTIYLVLNTESKTFKQRWSSQAMICYLFLWVKVNRTRDIQSTYLVVIPTHYTCHTAAAFYSSWKAQVMLESVCNLMDSF